jgi:hypothetical protein
MESQINTVSVKTVESHILKLLSTALILDDHALSVALKPLKFPDPLKLDAINALVQSSRILLGSNEKGLPTYKYVNEEAASKIQGMGQEAYKVYERIINAGDRGVTTNEIKNKLQAEGYTQVIVNKIVKELEKQGAVKKLKSQLKGGKAVYMLMEIEPSTEVTGGLAGNKNFNSEQLEIVQMKVLEYLKSHGHTTYREIALYIKQIGLLNTGSD